jgi:hypothetical protein
MQSKLIRQKPNKQWTQTYAQFTCRLFAVFLHDGDSALTLCRSLCQWGSTEPPGSSVSKIERYETVSRWLSSRMTCLSFHDIVTPSGKHPSSSQNTRAEYPTALHKNSLEWRLSCESCIAFNGNYAPHWSNCAVAQLVETLRYKPEGRRFVSR